MSNLCSLEIENESLRHKVEALTNELRILKAEHALLKAKLELKKLINKETKNVRNI